MGEGPRAAAPGGADRDRDRLATRRAELRRLRRRRRIAVGAAAAVALLTGLAIAGAGGGDIPARVSVGGVDIGGMSEQQAREALLEHGREVLKGRIALSASDDSAFAQDLSAGAVATAPLVDEAIAEAREARGRVGQALARFGLAGETALPLRFALRDGALTRIVSDAQGALGAKPVSATVAVQGEQIVTTPARPGRAIDVPILRERITTLPASVEVPVREARPPGDDDDAAEAKALAERILATPRTVTLGTRSTPLTQTAVLRALRFPVRKDTITVVLDADTLRSVLVKPLQANERPARDARFDLRGNRAVVIPSRPARRLNGQALGAAIVADPAAQTVVAKVALAPAEFTTAEARALKIVEKVSEFTTNYQCCQARVTNIQRAAGILDGTILAAGDRFSLNDALGERTEARGFVRAPTIAAGELVESFGGGVSQVATTMYNAAFFAGMALETHTPHEFYISRYPMGREATISWRSPDLVFRNDWDAAVLISVRAASNGVTIAFYSSKLGRRIETTTGEPTNRTQPKTIERQKPDLPPGTRNVIQSSGAGGFAISYTRKVYRGAKLARDETFRWTYRPQNAIVELGPPAPEEPEEPEEPGTPDGEAPTTTTGTAPVAPTP